MKLISFESWPIWAVVATLLMAAAIIGFAGARMTRVADRLADATQLGEALFGAVLLGGSTSLPGIITSIWTAYGGYPQLSVSNAIGGIAAQTVFLVVADITYRHVNLEHAAASFANLMQATLLMTLLAHPLVGHGGPGPDRAAYTSGIDPALGRLRLRAETGFSSQGRTPVEATNDSGDH